MKETHNIGIRARGFALSGAGVMYVYFLYIGASLGFLIVLITLTQFFPMLRECKWIPFMPSIFVLAILFLHMLCCFYTVILTPDMVILKWFGISVRRIPISRFQTFCAVGNGREDVLCFSCYSVDEMAQKQEERLLRSFLNKHDVPFRKRKADWQNSFAREYLNNLRKSPFGVFMKREAVMLDMNPVLQYSIRQMYPQLPYMNFTGVTSRHVSRLSGIKGTEAVWFTSLDSTHEVHMEPDGIHICTKKEEVSFIPAQEIKTAVRVDIFRRYDKYFPHHMPLLFITNMSEEELAAQVPSRGYGGFHLGVSSDSSLTAMAAATYLTFRWNKNKKNCCVVHHTEKNLQTLRTLYTHAQINEIAATWLEDSAESS